MFSGSSASTCSSVAAKPAALSAGRPAIRSMFTAKPPTARTVSSALRTSAAVCFRPMASSTASDMVWGLTLTRSTPCARSTRRRSGVMVSGRPASTVYSRRAERSNSRASTAHSRSSCCAESVVGVPPPIYSDTGRRPSAFTWAAVAVISRSSASQKIGTSFMLFSTDWLTKLQ
jgi:hypothetical protein